MGDEKSTAVYRNGLSFCLGEMGLFEESLEESRKVVALAPGNHVYLTDHGWCLMEAGQYDEAKKVLEKAVALAPTDYKLARGNLEELRHRMKKAGIE